MKLSRTEFGESLENLDTLFLASERLDYLSLFFFIVHPLSLILDTFLASTFFKHEYYSHVTQLH